MQTGVSVVIGIVYTLKSYPTVLFSIKSLRAYNKRAAFIYLFSSGHTWTCKIAFAEVLYTFVYTTIAQNASSHVMYRSESVYSAVVNQIMAENQGREKSGHLTPFCHHKCTSHTTVIYPERAKQLQFQCIMHEGNERLWGEILWMYASTPRKFTWRFATPIEVSWPALSLVSSKIKCSWLGNCKTDLDMRLVFRSLTGFQFVLFSCRVKTILCNRIQHSLQSCVMPTAQRTLILTI